MKKALKLFTINFLSLSLLLGCTMIDDGVMDQVDEDIELAHLYIDLLGRGEFAEAAELHDQKLQEELPEEALAEVWQQLTDEYGEYIDHELDEISNMDYYLVVNLAGQFEEMDISFQISVDSNSQIAGFSLN